LVALARLGAKCGIIGGVGSDLPGRFCKIDFEKHGIDTAHLEMDAGGETPVCLVISERKTRQRNILYHAGNVRQARPEQLDKGYIQSAGYLHLARPSQAARAAIGMARESGTKVSFDADSYHPETQELIPEIDVFIASEFYYHSVFNNDKYEENCRRIQKLGPEIVIFTLGGEGCVGADKNGFFMEPTFDVPVVDTVGAGDVFHGAFLFGLLNNWDARRCAKFANAVSSIKCTRIGGRAAIPDFKTAVDFMNSGIIDYEEIDKRVAFYKRGLEYALQTRG
jgi:sulfofructose kinase